MWRSTRILPLMCALLLLSTGCQWVLVPAPLLYTVSDRAPSARAATVQPALALDPAFLFNIHIDLAAPRDIGSIPELGIRHLYYFEGGTFTGPDIQGKVVPGGENWFLVRNNCVCDLYIQGQLRTADGALITFAGHGYSRTTSAIRQDLLAGAEINAADYAFRGVPFFETTDPRYGWLNEVVTVAVYHFEPDQVTLSVYAIR
jgi:hypothetical protein